MCLLLMAILYVFFFPSGSASAKSSDAVPVLLDTTKVTGEPIAKKTSQQSLELWHYSGGYWGFTLGGIEYRIYDSAMKSNWNSADALVNELMRNNQFKEKVRFEFSVPENVKQYLKSGRNVKLLLKKADGSNIDLKQIFKTDGDAIPKYEFSKDYSTVYLYTWPKFKFNGLYGESVSGLTGRNNNIPKVHPTYGYNVYAIWKNGSSIGYAKGNSLYQRNDASNSVYYPQRKGDLAYEFIKDDIGRLKTEGGYDKILVFDKNGEKWYNIGSGSNDVRIGWYTFKDVGAVGIHLWYPVQLEFYPEKDGNITADLIAAAEPDIVLPPNQTQDIEVTLDSSASEAFLEGEQLHNWQ